MTTPQRQDFILFSDQSVIPTELRAVSAEPQHHLFLVTSTMATQPLWLINALVETCVSGGPFSLNGPSASLKSNPNSITTIASLVHEENFYHNALRKLKVNANGYQVLDILTNFILKNNDKPSDKVLDELLELFPADVQSTIILEQPELLLSLIRGLTADELNKKFILPLMKKCKLLIVASSIDLFQNNENEPLDTNNSDVQEFTRFVTSLIYNSIVVMNLRSLDTGRSKDVTGSLMISRGGQSTNSPLSVHVVENEYLYLTQKDSTKLFYR
ncbi:similar to Saccharomyces cerevisiae YMR312W ELP6 Subunit of Elongator complex, which is required for modification of wobble nucleosides in tRNA [Maudiozyma saulgeensis]|uniref:Similar to Saccharomyces cerevisiae YMR312W ELP6 Subunit of Elongator complex, which is required for modification of wobble nucleosides in tRNA n=1 Tax=Maudiozyma saulgeensis TaxID=1789683 RepID=A0A1X7R4Q5_9SACH|nr:similar to Saccharomyces cerevisiae YMR312W ELP6 Subunit of Elongator complex, which is required for modification of wobble nucleosides in tRNA [Kazachstania saulgeensis]